MEWTALDGWIVATGTLLAMACALPGTFLILNRQSMLGDGISHAVLPGIAIAFLLTGSRDWTFMLAGAVVAGVLTGVISNAIEKYGKVESGAALGVTFCSLFALGLVLIRIAADQVEIHADCVLYGTLETAVIDGVINSGVPQVAWQAIALLLANALLVLLFYKELKIASFDPDLAESQGIPAGRIKFGITMMTAITTVMAFEAVGSILIIALLIVPASTAILLSHRLPVILVLACGIGMLTAFVGHWLAMAPFPWLMRELSGLESLSSASSTGMMAAACGLIFILVLITQRVLQRQMPSGQPSTSS
ncbi:MAG: metal ABC transporter permease [Verrucomicrobiota bacterium]